MRTTRRTLAVAFIALSILITAAPTASAAGRRRAAKAPAAAVTNPPPGGCHTFGFVRAGLFASYNSVAQSGNASFTITYISDTATQTRTTQRTVTAQGNADAETRLDGEVVGNLRALKHIYIKVTTVVPVLGATSIETDIDFVPSLIAGPVDGWCPGAKWTVNPSTQTVVVKSLAGTQQFVNQVIGSEGEVLAVGESVTVPGGTFNTVKYKSAIVSGNSVQPAVTWVSMEHNIVVKQDTLDASGAVTSVTELQSVR
jgi:hypothetical protein